MDAETVASTIMEQVIARFGVPSVLHSDQGRQYESKLFSEMCRLLGIRKTRTYLITRNQMVWWNDLTVHCSRCSVPMFKKTSVTGMCISLI